MKARDKERVWSLHCRGVEPSEIDRRMKLDDGTAVEVIVGMWRENSMKGKEVRG